MADSSLLTQIKRELIPYTLEEQLIDEENSERIGEDGSYAIVTKIKYCGTPCAAKEIKAEYLSRPLSGMLGNQQSKVVENFCAEIKMLSETRHPNFVRFIGVFFRESSPIPALVMELMHTSLTQCLERYNTDKKKFPLSLKLLVLQDVARALFYLHSQEPSIVHHDLTANNVLLTSNMKVKVADLGVSKILNFNSAKQRYSRTSAYMPPEMLIKEHPTYGVEIDVYSYGVLGFHIFSGKWPLPHGARKNDGGGLLSDPERCFVDLIGEGICLKETFEKCVDHDLKKRLTAQEILINVEEVMEKQKLEESDFLEIQYDARHKPEKVKEMTECIANQHREVQSKEDHIQALESSIENNSIVIEKLRFDFKESKSVSKQLEEENITLAQEVKTLRATVENQKVVIQELSSGKEAENHISAVQHLIETEHEARLPCQYCSVLEREKKDLSHLVASVQAQESNLASQVETKDRQLLIKKKEVESKEEEIKQLDEIIKLMNVELENIKVLNSKYEERSESENASVIMKSPIKMEQSKKTIETVKELKKLLSENDNKHKKVQEQYQKMLHDLPIPHKVRT